MSLEEILTADEEAPPSVFSQQELLYMHWLGAVKLGYKGTLQQYDNLFNDEGDLM
jgi:hypothetical protein